MGTSIFIIDQERTFADALAVRLEAEGDAEVVVAVHRQGPAQSLIAGRFADVVLLDADLPGDTAVDLCKDLSNRDELPRIIMLSRGCDPGRIVDSVRAGAAAWVSKSESLEHLLLVIKGVIAGEMWLPLMQMRAVFALLAARGKPTESDQLLAALTPREREVLACLADGDGRREVAERLNLSANTVRTHLKNLMAKLGVHSTLEAVAVTRCPSVTYAALTDAESSTGHDVG
ncbi:MAG TPA: response regulator transcription factor [Streptosporangiaceae bacterium]|nr:response regulator transcription factor [Streptosporangiaceae bacterium]